MAPRSTVGLPEQFRTLTLVAGGAHHPPADELRRMEEAGQIPRLTEFARTLHSDMLDERFLAQAPAIRRAAFGRLPLPLAQVLEAYALRSRYSAIISWAEHLGLPMAALLKTTRSRTVHVALCSWISRGKKARLLRRVHSHIDRLVLWSTVQRDFAVEQLGIPPSKVALTRYFVDQKFWTPQGSTGDATICSAGREMRDYTTLIEALRQTGIPCHIAAQPYPGKHDAWMDARRQEGSLPPGVSLGPRAPGELRSLYDRSRFVVIPLLPTDTDNGVTCILEAMAMGKAVICSRVAGQRDVIVEGTTGLYVPPGDPRALRGAIEHLWTHPEIASRMGREGRARIERYHTLDWWVREIRSIVQDAVREKATRRDRALGAARPDHPAPAALNQGEYTA